ncbi:hypothetical protein N9Y89_01610 [bacterium]|nr:hypothetical protein [bacterium]
MKLVMGKCLLVSEKKLRKQIMGIVTCVMLTERGSQFGYHELVVDFKGIPTMQEYAPCAKEIESKAERTWYTRAYYQATPSQERLSH